MIWDSYSFQERETKMFGSGINVENRSMVNRKLNLRFKIKESGLKKSEMKEKRATKIKNGNNSNIN